MSQIYVKTEVIDSGFSVASIPPTLSVYTASAVSFDASSDLQLSAKLTGFSADTKVGSTSLWFNTLTGSVAQNRYLYFGGTGSTTSPRIRIDGTTNVLRVLAVKTGPTTNLNAATTATFTTTGWHHVLMSWDLSVPTVLIYIDDVSDVTITTDTNNAIIYSSTTDFFVASSGTTERFKGYMSDVWFDSHNFIDFTSTGNRRKFIDASLKPVYLGANGEIPLGGAPDLFLSGSSTDFIINKGTGTQTFTVVGSLTDAPSHP